MTAPTDWPRVSVVLPVHNGERFLADALASVRAQAYAPLEVIVVDDGSTDGTPRLLAGLGGDAIIQQQTRQGPAAARNHGLRMARGEIVAFLDADDVWPRGMLRRHVAYLKAHPAVDIAQGLIQQMRLDPAAPGLVFGAASTPYQFIDLGSAVYRRQVFERVGNFDAALWENEDTDWFFRAWEQDVTKVVLPEVALFYRQHDDNLSRGHTDPQRGLVRLFKRHLDRTRAGGSPPPVARPPISEYIGTVPPGRP
ncbi:MAG: glycosyltransferase family 2 protein [Anaerolineae bacterium]|nr:glycosyltransferase family 2 protein [Anaerolineae bacterium]